MSMTKMAVSVLVLSVLHSCKTSKDESAAKDLDKHNGYTVY